MPVPSVVTPSLKVIVPVAIVGLTLAVKVTDWPSAEYGADELKVTAVKILLTTWVKPDDVLPL